MASSSSWLQSLFSPSLKALSNRLRSYGFSLGNVLNEMITREDLRSTIQVGDDETSCSTEPLPILEEVEKIIGYNFKNKSLLQQAFTHQSYQRKCVSYERLEFVGDSVLNLLITKQQFFMYPNLPPGLLSPLRAANVDTEKLARVAIKYNLHKYIRHNNCKLSGQLSGFLKDLPQYPLHSYGLIDPPKVLADIVGSTIGAVFIDSNSSMDITWEVAKDLLEPVITPEMIQTNPVQKLHELCQKNRLKVCVRDLWSEKGTYEVFVDDQLRGKGEYRGKKEIALNRAANDAYNEIVAKDLLEPVITPEMVPTNPVQRLQKMCRKHKLKVHFRDLWLKKGTMEVFVDNRLRGKGRRGKDLKGEYIDKKEIALKKAANDAYNEIVRRLGVKDYQKKKKKR